MSFSFMANQDPVLHPLSILNQCLFPQNPRNIQVRNFFFNINKLHFKVQYVEIAPRIFYKLSEKGCTYLLVKRKSLKALASSGHIVSNFREEAC